MCMQVLFANSYKQEVVSKTKKTYSAVARAIMLSQQNNGPVDEWYGTVENNAPDYFDTYFKQYFQLNKTCLEGRDCGYTSQTPWKYLNGTVYNWYLSNEGKTRFFFYLQDGTFIAIKTGGNPCAEYDENGNCVRNQLTYDAQPSIIADINGPKGPNILGRDVFLMQVIADKGVVPYCYNYTQAQVNSNCKRGGNGACCLNKIMMDTWELSKTYPL